MSKIISLDQKRLEKDIEAEADEETFRQIIVHEYLQDLVDGLCELGIDVFSDANTAYDLFMIGDGIQGLISRAKKEEYRTHEITNLMVEIENPREILEKHFGESRND